MARKYVGLICTLTHCFVRSKSQAMLLKPLWRTRPCRDDEEPERGLSPPWSCPYCQSVDRALHGPFCLHSKHEFGPPRDRGEGRSTFYVSKIPHCHCQPVASASHPTGVISASHMGLVVTIIPSLTGLDPFPSLRGALATKQSRAAMPFWIALQGLAMTGHGQRVLVLVPDSDANTDDPGQPAPTFLKRLGRAAASVISALPYRPPAISASHPITLTVATVPGRPRLVFGF